MNEEKWHHDEIYSHIDIQFDFLDTLRILLRRKARLTVRVKTENVPGRVQGESEVRVDKIFPRRNRPMMAVPVEEQ